MFKPLLTPARSKSQPHLFRSPATGHAMRGYGARRGTPVESTRSCQGKADDPPVRCADRRGANSPFHVARRRALHGRSFRKALAGSMRTHQTLIGHPDRPFPATLPYLGEEHRIVPTGRIRGTVLRASKSTLHVPGAPHRVMPRLQMFLRNEAEQALTPQVMALAEQLGKRPSAVRYRDPRAQWGSCSSSRVITLSWRVMMAAPVAQTYLVAHEVAHLIEMNHSRRFWKLVASLDPKLAGRAEGH